MISALPRETVFEARRRARRATVALFTILLVIYAVFFNLMAIVGLFTIVFFSGAGGAYVLSGRFEGWWQLNAAAFAVGAVVALVQFAIARYKKLDDILPLVGAVPIDKTDRYHARFRNLVEEAEVATGLHPIRPMVIPTTGLNACSVRTRDGMAICVTEGLISRLARQELGAVVAHEAGRLVSEDSRLTTTACAIVNVFGGISRSVAKSMEIRPTSYGRQQGGAHPAGLFVWIVAAMGHGLLSLVYMALARDRGFLADAHAVGMCKDPLALAEAIDRMSGGYRGCGEIRPGYEALFIVDPRPSGPSESEGLAATIFMTHPPLKRRLQKLLAWAKADVSALRPEERSPPVPVRKEPAGPVLVASSEEASPEEAQKERLYVNHDGRWRGPYLAMQILAMGILKPRTWIAANLAAGPIRASEHPALLPLFTLKKRASVSGRRCPRCSVSLVEKQYEGAPVLNCAFCDGYLLKPDVLGRIIARRERHFTGREVESARKWYDQKAGRPSEVCGFPEIRCPVCGREMQKRFHSVLVKVVLDFCTDPKCGAVWADGGELEHVQVIVEDASAGDG